MEYSTKAIISAVALSIFGIFLIWQGATGNVVRTIDEKEVMPRWIYILGGLGLLLLPVMYLIVLLQIK
jgi:hypothetical protein